MLSGTAEYALRAVVYLARGDSQAPVQADELARAVDVPRNYLGKILHQLVRARILRSTRGKHGGFRLARSPRDVTLLEIASLFDRIEGRRRCLLGRAECSDLNPCPVHHRWRETSEQISRFFRETTLADVLGDAAAAPGRTDR
jgi:Rrf2 family protein